jgi:2-Cys peroxiredoxin 5
LSEKGIEVIACVSVNDPFVMHEWGKAHGTEGKVRMLADPAGSFTKAAGLELDLTGALGNVRCKRFMAIIDNGAVTHMVIEPKGIETTSSKSCLASL